MASGALGALEARGYPVRFVEIEGAPEVGELVVRGEGARAVIAVPSPEATWRRGEGAAVAWVRAVGEAALRLGAPRLVYVSSAAVLAPGEGGAPAEEGRVRLPGPEAPGWVRAAWAAEGELYRLMLEGLAPSVAQPTVVLEAEAHGSVGSRAWLERVRRGEAPAPAAPLDVVEAEQVGRALVSMLERGGPGRSYVLASSAPVELGQLWARARRGRGGVLHRAWAWARRRGRDDEERGAGGWEARRYSTERAESELGWRPSPSREVLERGLGGSGRSR